MCVIIVVIYAWSHQSSDQWSELNCAVIFARLQLTLHQLPPAISAYKQWYSIKVSCDIVNYILAAIIMEAKESCKHIFIFCRVVHVTIMSIYKVTQATTVTAFFCHNATLGTPPVDMCIQWANQEEHGISYCLSSRESLWWLLTPAKNWFAGQWKNIYPSYVLISVCHVQYVCAFSVAAYIMFKEMK